MNRFLSLAALCVASTLALAGGRSPPTYCASPMGGVNSAGVVYEVVDHHQKVLYDFCPQLGCADGAHPLSTVIALDNGTLIGVTSAGGVASGEPPDGSGVIYRLKPRSDGSWTQEVLYDFCPFYRDCAHFGAPSAVSLVDQNTIEGVIQEDGGRKGVKWRFKLADNNRAGGTWSPIWYWTGVPQ